MKELDKKNIELNEETLKNVSGGEKEPDKYYPTPVPMMGEISEASNKHGTAVPERK